MNKNTFIKQLKKLVSFQTVTGNLVENSKALDFVETCLPDGIVLKRIKNKNAEILIASTVKSLSPKVGYLVHMDVVAGRPDQFSPKVNGDKVVGRGTSDMKFSIPIGIELLNFAKQSNLEFTLVITTDEETGGYEGGKFLVNNIKFKPSCLIVPDGGEKLNFVNKSKGVCQVIVESKGKTAHASRPWSGMNAIEPLVKLTSELIRVYGKNNVKPNWNTSMNIGMIEGGKSINQVCNSAVVKFDFRYPETDSSENIIKQVTDFANKVEGNVSVTTASVGMPTFTNTNLQVVKDFTSIMGKVFKRKILIKETYGASDSRFFSQFKTPILMMKPIAGQMHSEDEWVSVSSCLKFYKGLQLFVDKVGAKT